MPRTPFGARGVLQAGAADGNGRGLAGRGKREKPCTLSRMPKAGPYRAYAGRRRGLGL